MCQWFSCVSDGNGKIYYFDAEQRNLLRGGKTLPASRHATPISWKEVDYHSGICEYFGLGCDKVNKYEFRPLDRKFIVDQINTTNDQTKVKRKLRKLNYQELAPPELIIKPIFHPFKDADRKRVTAKDIVLLRRWASVVQDSVRVSVQASVRASVWASVGASVGASVQASVGASVRASVWVSVWAYLSSFFTLKNWKGIKHKQGENPFQPCIDLWMRGLVPSFDDKVWRLHGGKKGKILKEIII